MNLYVHQKVFLVCLLFPQMTVFIAYAPKDDAKATSIDLRIECDTRERKMDMITSIRTVLHSMCRQTPLSMLIHLNAITMYNFNVLTENISSRNSSQL